MLCKVNHGWTPLVCFCFSDLVHAASLSHSQDSLSLFNVLFPQYKKSTQAAVKK